MCTNRVAAAGFLFLLLWLVVAISAAAPACVPKGRYETAAARASEEQARRQELEREREQLARQLAEARARGEKLEERLSAAQYEAEIAGRERREAEERLVQLREELERIGEHIRHFAERNTKLERVHSELTELEQDISHRLSAFKELSHELGDLPPAKGVSLITMDGFPAIQFVAGRSVSVHGFNREGKRAVSALASVLESRNDSELIVLFAQSDDTGHSVADAVAVAVRDKLARVPVEVLEGEGVERGTAVAIVRRRSREER